MALYKKSGIMLSALCALALARTAWALLQEASPESAEDKAIEGLLMSPFT